MDESHNTHELNAAQGQLSPVKRALQGIRALRARIRALEATPPPYDGREPIAIVGAGLRFPGGVTDAASFWRLLSEGRDAITEIPRARWDWRAYFDPDPDAPGSMVTRYGGFLDEVDGFDAAFFGISSREVAMMDPQHRLVLEVAWEALENAGHSPAGLQGSATGVFLGISGYDYGCLATEDFGRIDGYTGSGNAQAMAAGRLSYLLGLHGPSLAVDTACSSSLVAVHLACQSLRQRECGVALAGGVNLILAAAPNVGLSKAHMMAADGHCKTFDDSADGYVRSEGCCIAVLRRLSDALADGDHILALIRGSAVNHDGRSGGLTAPNGRAQMAVMRGALENAGVQPSHIGFLEAHGTGTALGDPIEVDALAQVLGEGRPQGQPLAIGSVKTNIGHTEAASGIAGLMKTVLALEHRQIPPNLHLRQRSSHIDWERLPVRLPTELSDWNSSSGSRFAGVSSFGFSGTNAHAVLEEAPAREAPVDSPEWPAHILTISARTPAALEILRSRYVDALRDCPDETLADFCFTANAGRAHFPWRLAVLGQTPEQMASALESETGTGVSGRRISADAPEPGRVGFLFTGQGSQYAGMGRDLYETSPVFRSAMERAAAAWKAETGGDLLSQLYGGLESANGGGLGRASVAQAALFSLECALAELWRSWGIEPVALLGHSLGEYAAAVTAGIFRLEDGMHLVVTRSRLMEALREPGTMRSVAASEQRVREMLSGWEGRVSVATINGAESVVISGSRQSVEEVSGKIEAAGIRVRPLEVTHGFHSAMLEPMLEEFERVAEGVKYSAPRIRIFSNLTGKAAAPGEMSCARYWREQMRNTVRFHDGLQSALQTGCGAWIEIGPQPHLTALAKSARVGAEVAWLPSMRKGKNPWLDLVLGIKNLYLRGAAIDWKALYGNSGRRIALPTYPFERQRFWLTDKPSAGNRRHRRIEAEPGHPLLGRRVRSPLVEVQFESSIGPEDPAYLSDHAIAGRRIVPGAAYLEMALSAASSVVGGRASVRSAVFLEPCVFDEPQTLQCVLESKGSGLGRVFSIYSRPAAEEPEASDDRGWTLHATGEVDADDDAKIASEDSSENLDEIRERCGSFASGSDFYTSAEAAGTSFGPNFRTVAGIHRGNREALVDFEIPPDVQAAAGDYRIHPVMLDACVQAAGALLPLEVATRTYLPGAIENLRLSGDPRDLAVAHVRLQGKDSIAEGQPVVADVSGFDRSGKLILEAEGLMLRPLQPGALKANGKAAGQDGLQGAFYRIEWTPAQFNTQPEAAIAGSCIVAGAGGLASRLAGVLAESGVLCSLLPPTLISGEGSDATRIYEERLVALQQQTLAPLTNCIFVAPDVSMDGSSSAPPNQSMELQRAALGECVSLVQALLRLDLPAPPKFWIVTRGAQGPSVSNVAGSSLWGFGRSLAAEHPELRVARIDLDPSGDASAETLLRMMNAAGAESELASRGNEIYVPRLRRFAPKEAGALHAPAAADSNRRLERVRAGTIEGLEIVSVLRRPPGPGEVEIRVAAAGLNFRDVLTVLGMYPGSNDGPIAGPMGGECSGTVVRVGPGVDSLKAGDEVVALGLGCFGEFLVARAEMTWAKPTKLSFDGAATIPIAFLTAWYGLHHIADIQPGERVLIHAGAGGVGLAAIQIARQAGAEVFATAGSPEKRAYLASIGVRYVMDSRSLEFAREIREWTNGRGVDIVLNSLAGPFIDAGLELLAPGGRFVEMGAIDLRSQESVAAARPDVTYQAFNLGPALQAADPMVCDALTEMLEQFESGDLRPLPTKTFPLSEAQEAFRYMAQARHIGRVILSPAADAVRPGIRNDGAYLVTGGLSGIGREVSEWLVEQGAGRVIAMSRSGASHADATALSKSGENGAGICLLQGDVTKEADLVAAIATAGDIPLRGIFHCAGVLEDGTIPRLDWSCFERVLAPKLIGAGLLHRLTLEYPLDHFVLFSSAASVFGSPGQSNYAAANAYLDGLAGYRHSHGLPALSIDWGTWRETGMAERRNLVGEHAKIGLGSFSNRDGIHALEILMTSGETQVLAAQIDWNAYFAALAETGARAPFLSEIQASGARGTSRKPSPPKAAIAWRPRIIAVAPARRKQTLTDLLAERVRDTLGLRPSDEIEPDRPLQELGVDSLLSIELRNSLGASLECGLPATLLFNYPTLRALSDFLAKEILDANFADASASKQCDGTLADSSEDLAGGIEALSDEEVDRLLSVRTAESAP